MLLLLAIIALSPFLSSGGDCRTILISSSSCSSRSDCSDGQICVQQACVDEPTEIGDACQYSQDCRRVAYDVICENNRCSCGYGKEFRGRHCFETWKSTDTVIVVLSTFLPIALTVCLTLTIVSIVSRRRRAREALQSPPDVDAITGRRNMLFPAVSNSLTSPNYVPEEDKPPSYIAPPSYSTVMADNGS